MTDLTKLAADIIDAAFIAPPKGYKLKCENRELMIVILAGKIAEHLNPSNALRSGGLEQNGLEPRKLSPEAIRAQLAVPVSEGKQP